MIFIIFPPGPAILWSLDQTPKTQISLCAGQDPGFLRTTQWWKNKCCCNHSLLLPSARTNEVGSELEWNGMEGPTNSQLICSWSNPSTRHSTAPRGTLCLCCVQTSCVDDDDERNESTESGAHGLITGGVVSRNLWSWAMVPVPELLNVILSSKHGRVRRTCMGARIRRVRRESTMIMK